MTAHASSDRLGTRHRPRDGIEKRSLLALPGESRLRGHQSRGLGGSHALGRCEQRVQNICEGPCIPGRIKLHGPRRLARHLLLAGGVARDHGKAAQQLGVLRRAGLIVARREGSTVIYALADERIADLLEVSKQILLDMLTNARDELSVS